MGTRYSNDSFQLHGIFNGSAMSAAKTLRCLTDIDHDLGVKVITPESGAPYDETAFIGEYRPELKTAVAAIGTLTDFVYYTGNSCLTADGSHPGIRAFMQSHNACAANARTAGSAHQRVTIAKAQVLITSFGGNVRQTIYAKIRVIELSADGDANPHAIVYNAALPTGLIVDEEFVIGGQVLIGGLSIADENLLGWTCDTGVGVTVIGGTGLYAVAVDIGKARPTWRIQHDDTSICDDAKIPEGGLACTHADTEFWLRKRDPMGGLISKFEEEHNKYTAEGLATISKRYSASGSGVGSGEIMITSTSPSDGTTPLIALSGQAMQEE